MRLGNTIVYIYTQEFIMCKGKRVSNTLYTLCNKSSESNVTWGLLHGMWLLIDVQSASVYSGSSIKAQISYILNLGEIYK